MCRRELHSLLLSIGLTCFHTSQSALTRPSVWSWFLSALGFAGSAVYLGRLHIRLLQLFLLATGVLLLGIGSISYISYFSRPVVELFSSYGSSGNRHFDGSSGESGRHTVCQDINLTLCVKHSLQSRHPILTRLSMPSIPASFRRFVVFQTGLISTCLLHL